LQVRRQPRSFDLLRFPKMGQRESSVILTKGRHYGAQAARTGMLIEEEKRYEKLKSKLVSRMTAHGNQPSEDEGSDWDADTVGIWRICQGKRRPKLWHRFPNLRV
jgi:hypothetical protein